MPFTRKGLTQELKSFQHKKRATFICRHLLKKFHTKFFVVLSIHVLSITALSVATRRLEWSLHHSRELTSSNSTFYLYIHYYFLTKFLHNVYMYKGMMQLHTYHNILPNQPSELARIQLVGALFFKHLLISYYWAPSCGGIRVAICNCF